MSHLKPIADESQGPPTEAVWSLLGRQVDALLESWSRGAPPQLGQYLPSGPPRVRRLVLMELLKVDLEQRYARPEQRRRIEDYATEFEELGNLSAIPVDLIYEEFQIRRQAGEEPDPQEYFERFPHQAGDLIALLGLDSPYQSTTRFGREQLEQIELGERIDDFDLLVRLGRGAFATVFLARQRSLGRLVALKVSANRSSEPQTLAQLDHPYIVRVFDQRLIPERRLRLLYMQYVPGGTLQPVVDAVRRTANGECRGSLLLDCIDRELVNRGEEPPHDSRARQQLAHASWAQTVCWLGARLALALDYAHRRGVLHRDVKPANVLLGADASPKLVDFNIAANSKLEGVSPAAYFGGSLAYMSPEQLEACNPSHERQPEDLDGRSDIYSLGILLWELLTGQRPFADQIEEDRQATLSEMTARRRAGIPAAARENLPRNCPPGLMDVLETCLAPDIADRYATAGQLARQLELCLRPQTQRLLRPPARSWQQRSRTLGGALAALSITGLAPNGLLSGFNISYNLSQIVQPLGPAARDGFFRQLVSVNAGFYVGAFAMGLWLCWPVLRGLRMSGERARFTGSRAPLRRRSLVLGTYIGWITFALWAISGLVFPLVVQSYLEPGARMHWSSWVHFMGSQLLCGMLAATLVFFSMTFFCVRSVYPALLGGEDADEAEIGPLARVVRRARWQVGVAVSVPLLAVLLLAVLVQDTHVNPMPAFGMLALLGLGGSLAALALQRLIAADAEALASACAPGGSAGLTSSDLVDSFWQT